MVNEGHSLTTIRLQTFAAKPRFFAAAFDRRKVMAMDAFSQALSSVRMTGAIFVDADCTAPWGFSVPAMATVTHLLAPGTEHLVGYHLVTEGEALIGLPGAPDIPIAAGDIVIFPHGDAHTVANGTPIAFCRQRQGARPMAGGRFRATQGRCRRRWRRLRGSCAATSVASAMPRASSSLACRACIRMNLRGDGAGEWLETSIRHLLNDTTSSRPGRGVLLAKMAEAIFIETLRRYMEELPPEQTGWLAGARDPVVGAALALLHRKPCHPWTVAELASEAGDVALCPA